MLEYKIITPKRLDELQAELNEASVEGWKVVCSFGKYGNRIILKRIVKAED